MGPDYREKIQILAESSDGRWNRVRSSSVLVAGWGAAVEERLFKVQGPRPNCAELWPNVGLKWATFCKTGKASFLIRIHILKTPRNNSILPGQFPSFSCKYEQTEADLAISNPQVLLVSLGSFKSPMNLYPMFAPLKASLRPQSTEYITAFQQTVTKTVIQPI